MISSEENVNNKFCVVMMENKNNSKNANIKYA